jgi:hypothetical protein
MRASLKLDIFRMPYSIHPSGYAIYFSPTALLNLRHDKGGKKEFGNKRTRRGVFYDRVTHLWYKHKQVRLWTFTVPELQSNYKTTDRIYAQAFSKLVENYKRQGLITSYAYVSEAQKRGNIHFHLVTNKKFVDVKKLNSYWCRLINQKSGIAVHYSRKQYCEDIPDRLPAYLSKYMGKDHSNEKGRIIHARSFNTSRDLKFQAFTIQNHELPKHLDHSMKSKEMQIVDKLTGEIRSITRTEYYFKTEEIIRYFGSQFIPLKDKIYEQTES